MTFYMQFVCFLNKQMIVHDISFDETFGAVAQQSTAALRFAGSIPAHNKYLYGLQITLALTIQNNNNIKE